MLTALVAAVASFAGMVSVMNLTGYVVVDHGHHQADVFTVISLHIVGMYALVLVIGELVDRSAAGRVGRGPAPDGRVDARPRLVRERLLDVASLFGLGLGWNISYVAAVDGARRPGAAGRAREADRLHRPALELHRRRARAARRSRLQRARRRGAAPSRATAFVALPAAWILLRSAAGAPDVRPFSVK